MMTGDDDDDDYDDDDDDDDDDDFSFARFPAVNVVVKPFNDSTLSTFR